MKIIFFLNFILIIVLIILYLILPIGNHHKTEKIAKKIIESDSATINEIFKNINTTSYFQDSILFNNTPSYFYRNGFKKNYFKGYQIISHREFIKTKYYRRIIGTDSERYIMILFCSKDMTSFTRFFFKKEDSIWKLNEITFG